METSDNEFRKSRLPRFDDLSLNINDHIAALIRFGNHFHKEYQETPNYFRRVADMYAYLRDNPFNAETMDDALCVIAARRIPLQIMQEFVEGSCCVGGLEYGATIKGYPELSDILARIKAQYVNTLYDN